ncbi:MAG: proline dehydrogenase [Polyangiaceae bacterium]|nr:proline dehydrogenase [Polyangiaceae bacterium]MCW5789274.1 proline dehydrogenase [Polyangiaceae bacterium]
MSAGTPERAARVRALLDAARKIVDPEHPLGRRARAELPALTGLSPEGVEYALQHHLEVDATDAEIAALCASVPEVPCAHVLLSANVFVAALRALALGLAASPQVFARASRREPLMLELLSEASGGAFRIMSELVPRPGDHLFAYGDDSTLASLRAELAAGVVLHAHGFGFGVAVCEPAADARGEEPCAGEPALLPGGAPRSLTRYAELLARDVAVFDQRGCLSPRLVLVNAPDEIVSALGRELGRALSALEARMPRGALSADEAADVALYRDTMAYAGELCFAGKGCVGVDWQGRVMLPPVGRHLHLARTSDPLAVLAELRPHLTTLSVEGPPALVAAAQRALPKARHCRVGMMQRPPLDGPVDRRVSREGERL